MKITINTYYIGEFGLEAVVLCSYLIYKINLLQLEEYTIYKYKRDNAKKILSDDQAQTTEIVRSYINGYYSIPQKEIENDIGLSRTKQRNAIKKLVKGKCIRCKIKGIPGTNHYRILDNAYLFIGGIT